MKKITAIFVILAVLVVLFVSCGDDNNPTTTLPPINTGYMCLPIQLRQVTQPHQQKLPPCRA